MYSNFRKPQYGGRCFADYPATLNYWLTGEGQPQLARAVVGDYDRQFDTVIFFFVDAFGWAFFERFSTEPALQRFVHQGQVAQVTAQFPSATAGHVTSIHTGLSPAQSGVFEWQFYEPQLDALIAPLLFSFAGTRARETLKPTGVTPQKLFPLRSLYTDWQAQGITSHILQDYVYAASPFSKIIAQGANMRGVRTLPEALTHLKLLLTERAKQPRYFFFYYDLIDKLCHEYGPASPQVEAEILAFWLCVEKLFLWELQGRLRRTLLVVTADHGQMAVDPQTTIYLNQDPALAGLQYLLKTDQHGQPLVPAGAPRDLFLYVKEEFLAEAQTLLQNHLAGRAEVYLTQTLVKQGFFGPEPPSASFWARAGNLVILPYDGESVWWYEKDKFEMRFRGHHGGLSAQEMEIPLLLLSDW